MSDTSTAPITINGVTRTVTISSYTSLDETHVAHTPWNSVVATIGRGTARYPTALGLYPVRDGVPHHRGNTVTTDAEGRRWQYHLQTCVRNRQARIVGWNDGATAATNAVDQTRRNA